MSYAGFRCRVKPLNLLRPVGGDPPARRLAEPAVGEAGLPVFLVSSASSEQLSRLLLIELRRFSAVQNAQKHRHAHSLSGLRPAHPAPPKRSQTYRTDRTLPVASPSNSHSLIRPLIVKPNGAQITTTVTAVQEWHSPKTNDHRTSRSCLKRPLPCREGQPVSPRIGGDPHQ
jgi:hypothetical protein